jgi:hypothetical protein
MSMGISGARRMKRKLQLLTKHNVGMILPTPWVDIDSHIWFDAVWSILQKHSIHAE